MNQENEKIGTVVLEINSSTRQNNIPKRKQIPQMKSVTEKNNLGAIHPNDNDEIEVLETQICYPLGHETSSKVSWNYRALKIILTNRGIFKPFLEYLKSRQKLLKNSERLSLLNT